VRADRRLASARSRLAAAAEAGQTPAAVPLFNGRQVGAMKPLLVVRTVSAFRESAILSLLVVLASFFGLHGVRRLSKSPADPLLLPALLLLCGCGLTAMIGLRDPVRDLLLAPTFASGVACGALVAALAWRAPVERLAMQYAPLAAAFTLSLLLIAFGNGPSGSEARVNLWGFQPVELIRLLVVFYLAAFFARRWQHLRSLPDAGSRSVRWLRGLSVPPLEYVVPVAAALTIVGLFFVVQRDLGPALVFGCVFLALWAIAVRRAGLAVAGLLALGAGFWLVVRIGFPSTLATRVAMAGDPWMNARAGGDQIAHAFWALASGGFAGAGPGMGEPQYVPAGYTDLVLAVLGEELGFAGLLAIAGAYLVVCHRAVRIALRAATDFSCFLALGLALAMFVQLLLIAGGVFGLLPLSGVVTPFLSYGRSAMVANFAAAGLLLAISHRGLAEPRREAINHFGRPIRYITTTLAVMAVAVLGRAFYAQVWAADAIMISPALVQLADGTVRFDDNPRLLAAAHDLLPRGEITDRRGVVVAGTCPNSEARCYPFGGRLFHLLGDANTELDWRASNTSFVERDYAARLEGFNDYERTVEVQTTSGATLHVLRHDYRELIPLVRYRYRPHQPAVEALLNRPRGVKLTIDARLLVRVADILRRGVQAAGSTHGAAAVIDPRSGEVLAAVNYPWPADAPADGQPIDTDARLDRVRYGVYPPGSTFKLVTAAATLSLRPELAADHHMCLRLPQGRVGIQLAGSSRPIRDDALDTTPHGNIGLDDALRVSCNAYFAQLGRTLGPEALMQMASRFQIDVARPNTIARLRGQLPYAAFGQGETLSTPLHLLGVTSAIAAAGRLVAPRFVQDGDAPVVPPAAVMSAEVAARLSRDMATVVANGTGRVLARVRPAIAGKTGTAELAGGPAHSWFTGFAPASGPGRRLAFVVLVERGGYGGRVAAPIAGQIVEAARDLRLFEGEEK
jgi:cell division protein FtsW (lipid II flippase)